MAYTSGFFDAVDQGGGDYDRVYSASTFAHYFSLLVSNGVFPDPSTGMQVKASSNPDMKVSVQPGSGWVNGYYITVDDNTPEQLTIPTANPSLPRIDSVIMGLNYIDREIQLYIKSGAVSANPSAVSLQRDNDLYELELAQIEVGAGVVSIFQANITDMRQNTSRCGIVAGTIDQIDTTDLFAQYDNAFQTWFDDVQSQLSGDIAANLQNQINQLKTGKVDISDKATEDEANIGSDDSKWMTPKATKQAIDFQAFPIGDIKMSGIDLELSQPNKFMSCDGRALDKTIYSELYGKIADRFGVPISVIPYELDDRSSSAACSEQGELYTYAVSDSGELTVIMYDSQYMYLIIARFDSSGNLIGYYHPGTAYNKPLGVFYIGETCYLLTNLTFSSSAVSYLYMVGDSSLTQIWTSSPMYDPKLHGVTRINNKVYLAVSYDTVAPRYSSQVSLSIISVSGVAVSMTEVLSGNSGYAAAYLLGRTLYIGDTSDVEYSTYTDVESVSLPLQRVTDPVALNFIDRIKSTPVSVYSKDNKSIGMVNDSTVYVLHETDDGSIEENIYDVVNRSGVSISDYWLEFDENGLPVLLGLYVDTKTPYPIHFLLSTRFETTLTFLKESYMFPDSSKFYVTVPKGPSIACNRFFCMEKDYDSASSTSSRLYYWISIIEVEKESSSFCIPEDNGAFIGPISTFIRAK